MSSTVEIARRDQAVTWLLKNESPGIRYWTLKDLVGRSETDTEVLAARNEIAFWSPVAQQLREQRPEGYWGFAEDVYWPKWRATVWPLILLAEMGVPGTNPSIRKGYEHFSTNYG